MQIIIVQDVYKIKYKLIKLYYYSIKIKNKLVYENENVSFIIKILVVLSQIMVKMISLIVGKGLIQAIIAILI
ncbi:hypothetical protein [Spiroplasma endosymbiont of Cantharis rufa]|uniref:hypothetical protein n=1 Tax=Spiroplasma endosymbiont of Cantharis rufa TaxID=3066279 RepID=UPI0030CB587E